MRVFILTLLSFGSLSTLGQDKQLILKNNTSHDIHVVLACRINEETENFLCSGWQKIPAYSQLEETLNVSKVYVFGLSSGEARQPYPRKLNYDCAKFCIEPNWFSHKNVHPYAYKKASFVKCEYLQDFNEAPLLLLKNKFSFEENGEFVSEFSQAILNNKSHEYILENNTPKKSITYSQTSKSAFQTSSNSYTNSKSSVSPRFNTLKVRNETSEKIFYSLAYVKPNTGNNIVSKGWFAVDALSTYSMEIEKELSGIYIYGSSGVSNKEYPGNSAVELCVNSKSFAIENANTANCQVKRYFSKMLLFEGSNEYSFIPSQAVSRKEDNSDEIAAFFLGFGGAMLYDMVTSDDDNIKTESSSNSSNSYKSSTSYSYNRPSYNSSSTQEKKPCEYAISDWTPEKVFDGAGEKRTITCKCNGKKTVIYHVLGKAKYYLHSLDYNKDTFKEALEQALREMDCK